MFSLRITGGDVALHAVKETGQVLFQGVCGLGMGFIGAKLSKTNVVAATIIGGCEKLVEATVETVVKHSLGQTKNAKITAAVSSFLIGTIATIASVIFELTSPGMAVLLELFLLVSLGWGLYQAFQPKTTPAPQPIIEQMEVVVETEEPKGTEAVVYMELGRSTELVKSALGTLNKLSEQLGETEPKPMSPDRLEAQSTPELELA